MLGPGGALWRVLPAYEARPPQLAMAAQVEHALARGRALVVEAGTGTGKTLAYLLPAARSGLKTVVSTATKTLQEQLAEKDVPLLRALGVDAKVAFLKGRQNYLCLLRFEQFLRNPTFAVREEAAVFDAIAAWAETTQTGDRAELSELPENLASWRDLSATADQCIGAKCAHYDRCFVFRMRQKAAEADVIVVNHHLFFADLALRTSSAGDTGAAVLPKYDAVVFDEAHAVEEVATEHFGAQLSSFRVGRRAAGPSRAPLPGAERGPGAVLGDEASSRPDPLGRIARGASVPARFADRRQRPVAGQALRPHRSRRLHQRDARRGRAARVLRAAHRALR